MPLALCNPASVPFLISMLTPPQLATGAEVLVLVQEDRLVVKNEEAVFLWFKQ